MNSDNPFEYDRELLKSGMIKISRVRSVRRPRLLQSLSHNQLIAAMTIDYHRIEKGLAMAHPIANFGDKSGVIRRLWNMTVEYLRRNGNTCTDPILVVINDCIKEYDDMHTNILKREISSPYVTKLITILKYLDELHDTKLGGTIIIPNYIAKQFTTIQDVFFESRHSIRQFKPVVDNDLLDLIRSGINSAISGTPTVCNRRLNHVYMFSRTQFINTATMNDSMNNSVNDSMNNMSIGTKSVDSVDRGIEIIDRLLSIQNGNNGFGNDIPVLLVVNTCLDAFQDEKERRQPYISGGMFAMSIIYALHARGLATCCLNWDCSPSNDRQLRQLLVDLGKISPADSSKETCVMYIGVGKYPTNHIIVGESNKEGEDIPGIHIAASYKSPLKDVLVE